MPTTPYAKLLVSVNGGAPQSGLVTVTHGDTIALTAESTAQWPTDAPTKWAITMYPEDVSYVAWTGPGVAGWTTESVTLPGGGTFDVYVYVGFGPPTPFTMPALPYWGDYYLSLVVNGGTINGTQRVELTDTTTGLRIVGPNGLVDIPPRADSRFSSSRSYGRDLAHDLRILDAALIGSTSPYLGVPTAVTIGAGASGAIFQYALGDHSHPVTVGAPTTIAIGDAASAGAGTNLAGAAHVHALPVPTVVEDVGINGSGLGTSAIPAREDHIHAIFTFAPGGLFIGDVSTEGVETRLSRADHVHQFPAPATVTTVSSGAGTAGVSTTVAREDHAHQLTFTTLNSILATASAPITVNGQTVTSGGFIGPYFASSTTPATTGLLRAPTNSSAVVFRNAANSGDLPAVTCSSSDALTFGGVSAQNVVVQTATGTFVSLVVGSATPVIAGATACTFFGNPDAAGGDSVIQIGPAVTPPTTASGEDSSYMWTESGSLRASSRDLVKATLVPSLDNVVGSDEDLRAEYKQASRTTTIGAITVTALTIGIEQNTTAHITAKVVAFTYDDPEAAGYTIIATVHRFGAGTATLVTGSPTVVASHETLAGLDATIDVDGSASARIRVTGTVGLTYHWFALAEVVSMSPTP